jgi:hypothetical protein
LLYAGSGEGWGTFFVRLESEGGGFCLEHTAFGAAFAPPTRRHGSMAASPGPTP